MGLYEDFGQRLGYAEENISTIKAELVTVAHSTNILKPEINGMVGEFVGANFGFKLFNMEKTLFDFSEWRDRQNGLSTEELKKRIDIIMGPPSSSNSIGGVLGGHDTRIKKAQTTADEAKTAADTAGRQAREANTRHNAVHSAVDREGRDRTTRVADVTELRQAAEAVNRLENRVNRLVAALL